jgi:predicted phage terminase large subunit-like protein
MSSKPTENDANNYLQSLSAEELAEFLKEFDAQELEKLALKAHVDKAQASDDPQAFYSFFKVVFNKDITKHGRQWIETLYSAKAENKYCGIMAFRGSAKTTTLTIAFTAWRIGKEPHKSNLLIQVGDDIASNNTKAITDIIKDNIGWKLIFPHVVPDEKAGWGEKGYYVKRDDIPYEEWQMAVVDRKDPTLVGLGYTSHAIIGKHPTGVLVVDDIMDENNSSSDREITTVTNILTGTIMPTMTPEAWVLFCFTPWCENDPVLKITSLPDFTRVTTPVYEMADGVKVLTWPERFNEEEVEKKRRLSLSDFARMYLLDLKETQNTVFKYYGYPHEKINTYWPMVGGVDYAGTMNKEINKSGKNDFFAIAYVAKIPEGGAVVFDGVIARCTQEESEGYVVRAQELFPGWLCAVVEGDGKGEEFIQVLMRRPMLKLVPMKTGGKGKAARLEREMQPWFASGRVRISTAETPFLNELRKEMNDYPFNEHDDAMDAVYWALRGMPDVLALPAGEENTLPSTMRKQVKNPYRCLYGV